METDIKVLEGLKLNSITGAEVESDSIYFTSSDGRVFRMWHNQDCCETVDINEIHGNINDLIDTPILSAECSTNEGSAEYDSSYTVIGGGKDSEGNKVEIPEYADSSWTWTFYRFTTIKGSVQIKWFGTSNGYYSESVDFEEI